MPSRPRLVSSKAAPDHFLDEFLSFTARVRQLESWKVCGGGLERCKCFSDVSSAAHILLLPSPQDELERKTIKGASGDNSVITGLKPDIKVDLFKREGSGKLASKKERMPPAQATRVKAAKDPRSSKVLLHQPSLFVAVTYGCILLSSSNLERP